MSNKLVELLNRKLNALYYSFFEQQWAVRKLLDFSKKVPVSAISVVVVGRNDNYGGDFSLRLKTTLDWNLSHLKNPELIYVEWNPLPDRPSDTQWISSRYPNAKCFIVPTEIHKKIAANPQKMPVMEYFGKNLGIRKASNDWILLINADCFVGYDTIQSMSKLNADTAYGTHYVSIKWDGQKIEDTHLADKSIVAVAFPADPKMRSVVGNFILTHKKNWLASTGYDERMNNTRAGMDTNGLYNLLHAGIKPMAIGHHFHLDHPESIVNAANSTHGNDSGINKMQNIPYTNPTSWGLHDYPLKEVSKNVWELQFQ